MPDRRRYPDIDEFWRRLEERGLEPDLRATLRERATTEPTSPVRLSEAAVAFVARLLPGTIPPESVAMFVDEHFDQQLGRADDKLGVLPRADLIPLGFEILDRESQERHGAPFVEISPEQQDELISTAEKGELSGPEGFDSATWFKRTRGYALVGFGADPRAMVFMGFPGPSYRTGHVWLDELEVEARAKRRPGYRTL